MGVEPRIEKKRKSPKKRTDLDSIGLRKKDYTFLETSHPKSEPFMEEAESLSALKNQVQSLGHELNEYKASNDSLILQLKTLRGRYQGKIEILENQVQALRLANTKLKSIVIRLKERLDQVC